MGPLHGAERVGAVEDEDGDARGGAGDHAFFHGGHVGVVAGSDVGQVDDEEVDIAQLRGIGAALVAVEADDGDGRALLSDHLPRFGLPGETMFGGEDARDLDGGFECEDMRIWRPAIDAPWLVSRAIRFPLTAS